MIATPWAGWSAQVGLLTDDCAGRAAIELHTVEIPV